MELRGISEEGFIQDISCPLIGKYWFIVTLCRLASIKEKVAATVGKREVGTIFVPTVLVEG